MDLGGARLGGVIKLGLSEYVFCDHFGFVYAFALEECDRVVAAQEAEIEAGSDEDVAGVADPIVRAATTRSHSSRAKA